MVVRIHYTEVLRYTKVSRIDGVAKDLADRYGYLPYIAQRYIDMLGVDEAKELLEAFENLRPKPVIRCNFLRIDCRELVERLEKLGFVLEPLPWCSYCYRVVEEPGSPTIGSTHEYLKGFYYVYRDAPSTIPPVLMDIRPGQIVLDMCAAPGGKATHMLQLMEDRGLLVANDKALSRIPVLISHLYRMGFSSFVVLAEDGRRLPEVLKPVFDRILVDAPCSAEGGIMFDPSRKIRTTEVDLAKLVAREIELLDAAIELSRPGTLISYITCSIAPEENEFVITWILRKWEGTVEVVEPPFNRWDRGLEHFRDLEFEKDVSRCIRIWPHRHGMEGFFICLLRKR